MKRILLSLAGFILIYLLAVVVINILPEKKQPEQPETPQIQVQEQPQKTGTPSAAQESPLAPDL